MFWAKRAGSVDFYVGKADPAQPLCCLSMQRMSQPPSPGEDSRGRGLRYGIAAFTRTSGCVRSNSSGSTYNEN